MTLRYGSVCSGIEAASVAWEPLGWTPAWFCEIEPFPSAVLAHRYPGVPNHGDFTQLLDPAHPVHREPPIDVLVGGTPCQDFSIAGLRAGIEGQRGSLTLDFCRLVDVLRPRWVVWENVPGVLSSDGGRAFGSLLGALAELGFGFAWRVLDAQHFGLAQRRKRVFVVSHSGGSPSGPGAVLLEPEGVRGDPPTRRSARKNAAPATAARAGAGGLEGGGGRDPAHSDLSVSQAVAFNAYARTIGDVATEHKGKTVVLQDAMAFDYKQSGSDATVELSPTLRATPHAQSWANGGGHVAVLEPMALKASHYTRGKDGAPSEVTPPLSADADKGDQDTLVLAPEEEPCAMTVRRLTPRECERLQGFPDDWTLVPYCSGLAADANRYRVLGNSMAVPVMRWIGARIQRVDAEITRGAAPGAPQGEPSTRRRKAAAGGPCAKETEGSTSR